MSELVLDPLTGPDVPLSRNPYCLYGWGPPVRANCHHRFGHACYRPLGHRGKCHDGEPPRAQCEEATRPKDWDATGRAKANA